MATLQRSVETFRRTGSSGLVWDNRDFLGDRAVRAQPRDEDGGVRRWELRPSQSLGSVGMMELRRSSDGPAFSSMHDSQPAGDPPSPKISGRCCVVFRMPEPPAKQSKPIRGKSGPQAAGSPVTGRRR